MEAKGSFNCYLVFKSIPFANKQEGRIWDFMDIYRVFHDLWTLLQEVISQVFVIRKVHINMCPILDGYGVMTA